MPELARAGRRAARGSGPGWSRRARSSARRRPAGSGSQASAIGDHHALAHAAGELVRVLVELLAAAPACRPARAPRAARSRAALARRAAVEPQRLGDLVADGHRRVQRGHRVLEDHRRPRARGSAAARTRRSPVSSLPVEPHAAADDAPAGRQQPQQSTAPSSSCRSPTRRRGRSSRPVDVERHPVDRVDRGRARSAISTRRSRTSITVVAVARARSPAACSRTSKASRSASPMKLNATDREHDRDPRRVDEPPVAGVDVVRGPR